MPQPIRTRLFTALALTAALAACGGGDDDPALGGDASGDAVAKYIGSWQSDCYADSGASARARADFTKTSATSFTGKVVVYGYLGGSCSGPVVRDENAITGLSMAHAGTKTVEGVTADKFSGSSDQGESKLVLWASGDTMRIGDVDAGKDAEGYANAFLDSRFTLQRLK